MRRGPVPVGAEHPHGVRVVDRECGTVFLGDFEQVRHVGDVPLHREHPAADNMNPRPTRHFLNFPPKPAKSPWVKAQVSAVERLAAAPIEPLINLAKEPNTAPPTTPED